MRKSEIWGKQKKLKDHSLLIMTKGKEIKFPGKKKEKQKQCGFKDGPQRREEEEEVGG